MNLTATRLMSLMLVWIVVPCCGMEFRIVLTGTMAIFCARVGTMLFGTAICLGQFLYCFRPIDIQFLALNHFQSEIFMRGERSVVSTPLRIRR